MVDSQWSIVGSQWSIVDSQWSIEPSTIDHRLWTRDSICARAISRDRAGIGAIRGRSAKRPTFVGTRDGRLAGDSICGYKDIATGKIKAKAEGIAGRISGIPGNDKTLRSRSIGSGKSIDS